MSRFLSQTEVILTAAGWYEERKIDVSPYTQYLQQEGYTVFPVVREFFEQFGGLILTQSKPIGARKLSWFELIREALWAKAKFPDSSLNLRVEQTLSHFAGWEPDDLIEKLNISMCPIGHDSDGVIYGMDAGGKVYGSYWPTYYLVAESGEQFIKHYCTRSYPYQVIYEDVDD